MLSKRTHAISGAILVVIALVLITTRMFPWHQTLGFILMYALIFVTSNPSVYFRLFPELHSVPEKQRSDALQSALFRQTTLTSLAVMAVLFGSLAAAAVYLRPFWEDMFPVLIAAAPLCAMLPTLLHRGTIRRNLRKQLRAQNVLLCLDCGYDLKGSLKSDRCPECGTLFADQPA